ncbi:MAG: Mur ligase family protein, partial [Chitinophagales bacterium]
DVIQPTIGIFTNIGQAHDAGFQSADEKADEKIKLFTNCRQIIYCKDHALIHRNVQSCKAEKIAWSKADDSADWFVRDIRIQNSETYFTLIHRANVFAINIPFTDEASLENAVHAFIAAYTIQPDADLLIDHMQHLPAISMRLELKKGVNNCTLINDVYSADLASLEIALHYLNQQSGNDAQEKHVILSDIDGSGEVEEKLYEQVAGLLQQHQVQHFTGIGESILLHKKLFEKNGCETNFFKSTEEAIAHLKVITIANQVILIKGARRYRLERISNILSQRT